MSELRFEDVTVRYGHARRGVTAVDRVSLTVPDGQVVGLVGSPARENPPWRERRSAWSHCTAGASCSTANRCATATATTGRCK